jgi:hypothetical protein
MTSFTLHGARFTTLKGGERVVKVKMEEILNVAGWKDSQGLWPPCPPGNLMQNEARLN